MKYVSLSEDLLQDLPLRRDLHSSSLIFQKMQRYKILVVEATCDWHFFYKPIKVVMNATANISFKKLKSILLNSKTYPSLNYDWEGIEWNS